MEGQGTTQFQLIPSETYSENFERMVVGNLSGAP